MHAWGTTNIPTLFVWMYKYSNVNDAVFKKWVNLVQLFHFRTYAWLVNGGVDFWGIRFEVLLIQKDLSITPVCPVTNTECAKTKSTEINTFKMFYFVTKSQQWNWKETFSVIQTHVLYALHKFLRQRFRNVLLKGGSFNTSSSTFSSWWIIPCSSGTRLLPNVSWSKARLSNTVWPFACHLNFILKMALNT